MAEPQPPMDPGSTTAKPSKDDAAAAAALSSLDSRGEDDNNGSSATSTGNAALAGAMKDLKVDAGGAAGKAKEAPKKVKIDAKDVAAVVEWCEVGKAKATEMLRGAEGDLGVALGRYVEGKA